MSKIQTEQVKKLQGPLHWKVKEHEPKNRGNLWHLIAGIVAIILIVISILTANWTFALLIALAAFIVYLFETEEAMEVEVSLEKTGIQLGKKFYHYALFSAFYIINRPSDDIKNLYFEFAEGLRNRITIPLMTQDPELIRTILRKYVYEDQDQIQIPLSESLARMLRL